MMSSSGHQIGTKLAPIFDIKSNKKCLKESDLKSDNRRKRKKKSEKNDNKNKSLKKFDSNDIKSVDKDLSEDIVRRRSQRLCKKVVKNDFNYDEETDEETNIDNNLDKSEETSGHKLNESVVLLDDDSDITIDYLSDLKTDHIYSTDDDIEILPTDNSVKCCEESKKTVLSSSRKSKEQKESILWTEKYKPKSGSQIVGHKSAVNQLKYWLENWGKTDSNKYVNEDTGDSDNCLDETNACLLICGPTGWGKTSMVYAIAEELKYEVLELNASMKRNGRIISKILGEATQSHQMQRNTDSNGFKKSITSFFTSVANNNINKVSNDIKIDKNVKNKKSKPKGILNYFSKQSQNLEKSSNSEEIEIIDTKVEQKISESNSLTKTNDKAINECPVFAPKGPSIATKSLILFDDIDVMIDDDFVGFWSAFNRINETTKKPVILTATQFVPYIKESVSRLQVLTLGRPDSSQTIEWLRSVCDKERNSSDSDRNEKLCKYLSDNDNDIRRCLNELQFGTDLEDFSSDHKLIEKCDNKLDITSYYDSVLFSDVIQTKFRIFNDFQNRNNWMNCRPNSVDDNDYQSTRLAKDIIESMNELNLKVNSRSVDSFTTRELPKPIDSDSIEAISHYLSPNTSLKTLLMEYLPYLSLICESESMRHSMIANHSRKSRRFMHHLDSIDIFVDNIVKTKLISAFIPDINSNNNSDNNSEQEVIESNYVKNDDYFYE